MHEPGPFGSRGLGRIECLLVDTELAGSTCLDVCFGGQASQHRVPLARGCETVPCLLLYLDRGGGADAPARVIPRRLPYA
jgi:hypothetical protein